MQEKNKKTLLNIFILSALALTITSFFYPITYFNYSDVLDEYGYDNSNWYWTLEGYLFMNKLSVYTYSEEINQKVSEFHRYTFFSFFKIEIGEKGDWTEISDYNIGKETLFSKNLASMIGFVFSSIFLFLFTYFCYKFFKHKSDYYRKKEYLLYIGFIMLFYLIGTVIGIYLLSNYHDTQNLGFTNFITFGYGFYLACIGILLFFISYFIQSNFWNLSKVKKSNNIEI